MKKILILIFIFSSLGINLPAQDVGKINVGVVVPEKMEGLEASQIEKIKTKLEQICVKNGVSAGFTNNGFVIYPVFEIYESEVVEGGMQNIYVVKVNLTLFIKQIDGATFSSAAKVLRGSGKNKNMAIVNAISNIDISDPIFQQCIMEGKEKVVAYYNSHCIEIMNKAEAMAKQEQYETAIGLLMNIPENVNCYAQALDKATEIYNAYQDKLCAELVSVAQAAIAIQDYVTAAQYLTQINPNSGCYSFAVTTFQKLEKLVSDLEKRDWNFKMKQYEDNVNLEKQRIEAIKEVAKAYYSNQPEVHYTEIIGL